MGITWESGQLKEATIRSDYGQSCTVRATVPVAIFKGEAKVAEKDVSFETEKGTTYSIRAVGNN